MYKALMFHVSLLMLQRHSCRLEAGQLNHFPEALLLPRAKASPKTSVLNAIFLPSHRQPSQIRLELRCDLVLEAAAAREQTKSSSLHSVSELQRFEVSFDEEVWKM